MRQTLSRGHYFGHRRGASLSCEEMKRLTEPAKDCFAAIYLLCGMDVVRAWPDLGVLRGEEGF
jgi:hypothetical protein